MSNIGVFVVNSDYFRYPGYDRVFTQTLPLFDIQKIDRRYEDRTSISVLWGLMIVKQNLSIKHLAGVIRRLFLAKPTGTPQYNSWITPKPGYVHIFSGSGSISISSVLRNFHQDIVPKIKVPIIGYIVIVNADLKGHSTELRFMKGDRDSFYPVGSAKEDLRQVKSIVPDANLVVAVVNPDVPDAITLEDLRTELSLPTSVPMVTCDLHDQESVKSVLNLAIRQAQMGQEGLQLIQAIEQQASTTDTCL